MSALENQSPLRLLHLHQSDNVVVLAQDGLEGAQAQLDGASISLPCDLKMGHKLAICAISQGSDIIKYGAPIGVASCDIVVGAHVHLHNIQSRYTVIEDMERDQT